MLCTWRLVSDPWWGVYKIIGTQVINAALKFPLGAYESPWDDYVQVYL